MGFMPLLLILLVGMALALITWGLVRHQRQRQGTGWLQDDLLVGALILAAFALGVFLTYSFFVNGGH
jgi:hypothetical protein